MPVSARRICIKCKAVGRLSEMLESEMSLTCPVCGYEYRLKSGIEYVIQNPTFPVDFLDKIKNVFKKSPLLYNVIGIIIGPLLPNFQFRVRRVVKNLIKNQNIIGINLGSGTSNFDRSILNVDFAAHQNVDMVADISDLPFNDNIFDLAILTEVIEHAENPTKLISEIARVMKHDGVLILTSPFMIGYHASPDDFQRFTLSGLTKLLSEFKIIETRSYGPTGSLLWIFQEWCALWFSFGNRKLHTSLVVFFMILTSPIKVIDFLLSNNRNCSNIASTYFIIAKKI
jgi:SAM-dependent methyltransferase